MLFNSIQTHLHSSTLPLPKPQKQSHHPTERIPLDTLQDTLPIGGITRLVIGTNGSYPINATLRIPTSTPPKALLFITHGSGESSTYGDEKLADLLEDLVSLGFAAISVTLASHGTPNQKSGTAKYEDYVHCLKEATKQLSEFFPDMPFFIIAYSISCNFIVDLLISHPKLPNLDSLLGVIFTSACIMLHWKYSNPVVFTFARVLRHIMPDLVINKGDIQDHPEKGSLLSSKHGVAESFNKHPKTHSLITLDTIVNSIKTAKKIKEAEVDLNKAFPFPLLSFDGKDDTVVCTDTNKNLCEKLKHGQHHEVRGRHDPIQDIDREIVKTKAIAWLLEQLHPQPLPVIKQLTKLTIKVTAAVLKTFKNQDPPTIASQTVSSPQNK